MKTQKFIVKRTAESQIGNSINWLYAYASFLEIWHSEHPEWVFQIPGDWEGKYVGFITDGPDSRFVGELRPPKNPARRVFWEADHFLPREWYHFNIPEAELQKLDRENWDARYEDDERIEAKAPGSCWYNYKPVAIEKDGRLQAVTLLSRDWYHQWWHLGNIYFGKGANLEACAKAILDAMRR